MCQKLYTLLRAKSGRRPFIDSHNILSTCTCIEKYGDVYDGVKSTLKAFNVPSPPELQAHYSSSVTPYFPHD
jgi:hypothetical protein